MTHEKRRKKIIKDLIDIGYSRRDAIMFLAGATLLGYLADDRASWARDHLIRKYIDTAQEGDQLLERAGDEKFDLDEWQEKEQRNIQEIRKNCRRCRGAGMVPGKIEEGPKVPCPVCNRQSLR